MDWNYLLFTLLGFFIGIFVCFFYVLGVKPIFNNKTEINLGDIVYYKGEMWEVDWVGNCYCMLSRLDNGVPIYENCVEVKQVELVKKVIRAD